MAARCRSPRTRSAASPPATSTPFASSASIGIVTSRVTPCSVSVPCASTLIGSPAARPSGTASGSVSSKVAIRETRSIPGPGWRIAPVAPGVVALQIAQVGCHRHGGELAGGDRDGRLDRRAAPHGFLVADRRELLFDAVADEALALVRERPGAVDARRLCLRLARRGRRGRGRGRCGGGFGCLRCRDWGSRWRLGRRLVLRVETASSRSTAGGESSRITRTTRRGRSRRRWPPRGHASPDQQSLARHARSPVGCRSHSPPSRLPDTVGQRRPWVESLRQPQRREHGLERRQVPRIEVRLHVARPSRRSPPAPAPAATSARPRPTARTPGPPRRRSR